MRKREGACFWRVWLSESFLVGSYVLGLVAQGHGLGWRGNMGST